MKFHQYQDRHNIYEPTHYFLIALSNLFVIVCTVIAVAMIAFQIIFDSAPVIGQSMNPTLNLTGSDTDRVYINNFAHVTYNDVVVLTIDDGSGEEEKNIIKRVIGLEGDRIKFQLGDDGYYYVVRNGKILIEDYIKDYADNKIKRDQFVTMCQTDDRYDATTGEYVVGNNEVFVLGDNRGRSSDSASVGAISLDCLWGRVDYVTPTDLNFFVFFGQQFFTLGKIRYTF